MDEYYSIKNEEFDADTTEDFDVEQMLMSTCHFAGEGVVEQSAFTPGLFSVVCKEEDVGKFYDPPDDREISYDPAANDENAETDTKKELCDSFAAPLLPQKTLNPASERLTFICIKCEEEFRGESAFKSHSCLTQPTLQCYVASPQTSKKHKQAHSTQKRGDSGKLVAAKDDLDKRKRNKKSLRRTRLRSSERLSYTCITCQEVFYDETALESHSCPTLPNLQCYVCKFYFAGEKRLKEHRKVHYKQKTFATKAVLDKYKPDKICVQVATGEAGELSPEPTSSTQPTLKCYVCKDTFACPKALKSHRKIHSSHKCNDCGKGFATKSVLDKHKRDKTCLLRATGEYTRQRKSNCYVCKKNFDDLEELKEHRKTHRTHVCEICGNNFSTEAVLATHQQNKSCLRQKCRTRTQKSKQYMTSSAKLSDGLPLTCYLCKKAFTTLDELKEHRMVHRSNLCSHCGRGFTCRKSLNSHICEIEGKKHACPSCGERFTTKVALRRHHVYNHKVKVKRVRRNRCRTCKSTFASRSQLAAHRAIHIRDSGRHRCVVCNKAFKSADHLKTHSYVHTGEKPFVCSFCGMSFKRLRYLQHHEKIHTDEKVQPPAICLVCAYCGKTFKSKFALVYHEETHSSANAKKFSCSICGKTFTHRNTLKWHEIRHQDPKPFECELCGKKFSHKYPLKLHRYNTHNIMEGSIKFHDCDYCKKRFTNKDSLKRHMLTHTGLKPFKCSICALAFGSSYWRYVHEKKHGSERSIKDGDEVGQMSA